MSSFKTRPWCPYIAFLLGAALVVVLMFFVVIGKMAKPDAASADQRAKLLLTDTERDFVLTEMRAMLSSVQVILDASLAGDMPRAAKAARSAGMDEVKNIPPEIRAPLIGKLPLEFKQLGFSVHGDFDQIALDAESLGDREHTFRQVSRLMQKCVACHGSYAIAADNGKAEEK
jgi:hypothetical protein